jgi:hypothetical protein
MSKQRYEIKFTCAASLLPQARSWLRLHPAGFRIAYPPRWVNSLYFDTAGLASYQDNIVGVSERQKLRLRWYGTLGPQIEQGMLELKRKENLLGDKLQRPLTEALDLQQPFRELQKTLAAMVQPVWRQRLQTANQPTLLTRYRRDYLEAAEGHLRATIDYQVERYDQRLSLRPNLSRLLPPSDILIIELKAGPEHFAALQEAANALPVRRSRSSKYAGGLFTALQ